ncbi:MHC class II transactivator [Mantella aurantiaca]
MQDYDCSVKEFNGSYLQLLSSDMDQLNFDIKDVQISVDIPLGIERLCENNFDIDIDCSDADFNGLLRYVNDEKLDEENKDQLQDLLNLSRSKAPPEKPPSKHMKRGVPLSTDVTDGMDGMDNPLNISDISYLTSPSQLLAVPADHTFHTNEVSTFFSQQALSFSVIPLSNVFFCTAPHVGAPEPCAISTSLAVGSPTVSISTSIPSSLDRNYPSSPFVPSEVDLPSSPKAASMCQCHGAEHVEAFQELQKKQYREAFPIDSDTLYTEIELLKSRINSKRGKVFSKTLEKVLINYDLTEQQIARVDLWKLFDNKEWKELETRIIALLGDSGMGKTVLVKKICQEWSKGKYDQFSFVFYYECGHLDTQKLLSIKDFLFQLSSFPSEKNMDIYQYILRNPEKVLLIFDGFDEFQNSEILIHGPSTTPPPGKTNKVQEIFTSLFQKKLLRGCTMLITARPREKLNLYLGKVDQIIEMMGFTPQQVECYIKEYFKSKSNFTNVLEWIKEHQYLYSYCYIPFICKCMCLFAKLNYYPGAKALSLSLSSLFFNILQNSPQTSGFYNTVFLKQYSTVNFSVLDLESDKKKKLHKHKHPPCTRTAMKNMPSYNLVQSFCKARHAVENMSDRNLIKYISLDLKKRRNVESCPDMVRRFLVGLLYYKNTSHENNGKVQKKMADYFQTLKITELWSHRFLELLHCMHSTHLAPVFNEELSFADSRITPPDVFILKHFLIKSKVKISLDLRRTGINKEGLQELVCLKSIKSFRASLSDTVNLWKKLLAEQNYSVLKNCVKKFTVEPFRAEHVKDITDLAALVNIQDDICYSNPESPGAIKVIPAVKSLKCIIFGLGKKHGQDGFLKLVDSLPKFPELQVLDISNLTENHIGDEGVEKLVETFPELQNLQILDLSQNNITGLGAKILATALPSLCSLQTLSLYNNNVCDMGAEQLAVVLPKMASLEALHLDCNRITDIGARKLAASLQNCPQMKSLRMYNMTIPHSVLLHLQQQDSRISCMSIG